MDSLRKYCGRWQTWIVLAVTAWNTLNTGTADSQVTACFNQTEKTLTMSCPEGHMVKVNRMIEGYSEAGLCGFTEGDCSYEHKHTVIPCIGRQNCEVNLPSGSTGVTIHTCGKHGTYLQIDYSCIPVASNTDICEMRELTSQSGYIMTPRYPSNYPDNRNCTLTIRLPYKQQRLKLYAIDLMLESSREGCPDLLYLYDGFRSNTKCGSDARKELILTMSNYLQLTFESNSQNREKGFWLYFEAFPYVNQTTTVSNSTATAQAGHLPKSTTTTTTDSVTVEQLQHLEYKSDNGFPLGLVIGILVSVLVCLVVVLVIIICARRRQQPTSDGVRKPQSGSKLPVNCPMNNLDYQQQEATTNSHNIQTINKICNINSGFTTKDDKLPTKQPFIDTCLETGDEKLIC